MSIAFIHGATATSVGNTTSGPTLTVTAGNQLVLGFSYDNTTGPGNVTGGGTWTSLGSQLDATNGQRFDLWYCPNAAGGSTTPQLAAGNIIAVTSCLIEFSGGSTGAADASNTALAFGTDVLTSNAITTTNAGSQSATATQGSNSQHTTMQVMAIKAASGTDEAIVGHYCDGTGVQSSIGGGTGFSVGAVDVGVSGTASDGLIYKIITGGAGATQQTFFRLF